MRSEPDRLRFEIVATDGAARAGVLHTPHGPVETPCFVPLATRGSVKGLLAGEVAGAGYEMVLGNTYHLMLAPGHERIAALGGLHRFMGWERPISQLLSAPGSRAPRRRPAASALHRSTRGIDRMVRENVELRLAAALRRPQAVAVKAHHLAPEDQRPRPVASRWITVGRGATGHDNVVGLRGLHTRVEPVEHLRWMEGAVDFFPTY